jgi:hypothetical protein
VRELTVPSGLTVLARAVWPATEGDALPPIAGFIVSAFNPLVAEVAERCLRAHYGAPPADPERAETTAVVLASVRGDTATAAAVAAALAEGRRVPPLLFFQSNPNAVVGHITARWGLAGPVVCTSPAGDALADALAEAELLIVDGDATEVLVIVADLGSGAGSGSGSGSGSGAQIDGDRDGAVALLVGPPRPAVPADRQSQERDS